MKFMNVDRFHFASCHSTHLALAYYDWNKMSELIALISAGGHPDKVAIVAEQSDEPTPHRIGYSRLLQNVHELEQILKTFGV